MPTDHTSQINSLHPGPPPGTGGQVFEAGAEPKPGSCHFLPCPTPLLPPTKVELAKVNGSKPLPAPRAMDGVGWSVGPTEQGFLPTQQAGSKRCTFFQVFWNPFLKRGCDLGWMWFMSAVVRRLGREWGSRPQRAALPPLLHPTHHRCPS